MPLRLPTSITVVDVGPRDGLQSFPRAIDTETKIKMIDRLSDTGLPVIEVTNFAHPRVIPNLADAEAVCGRIKRRPGVVYRGLVPNARGAERALSANLDELLGRKFQFIGLPLKIAGGNGDGAPARAILRTLS